MIANIVWKALGQPDHYLEPFFGSGAVLLARPSYDPRKHTETICDKDGYVANVWRALQADPDAVAKVCDWPVNHADLSARRKRLLENKNRLLENLIADDKWYDAELAGFWIWAASCWIGSGLTRIGQRPHLSNSGMGIHALGQIPHLSHKGDGVHALGKIPHLCDKDVGVHRISQTPHLADKGKGVNAISEIPDIGGGFGKGKGIHTLGKRPQLVCSSLENTAPDKDVRDPYNINIYRWFRVLSERLRYVRVVCGDWTRVCGGNWQDSLGVCGIFFDPPYGDPDRDDVYGENDDFEIAHKVREWCLERGSKPTYRIVLAGYGEHKELLENGWRMKVWKAVGGYGNIARGESKGKRNRFRETLYFSPYCLNKTLFD